MRTHYIVAMVIACALGICTSLVHFAGALAALNYEQLCRGVFASLVIVFLGLGLLTFMYAFLPVRIPVFVAALVPICLIDVFLAFRTQSILVWVVVFCICAVTAAVSVFVTGYVYDQWKHKNP